MLRVHRVRGSHRAVDRRAHPDQRHTPGRWRRRVGVGILFVKQNWVDTRGGDWFALRRGVSGSEVLSRVHRKASDARAQASPATNDRSVELERFRDWLEEHHDRDPDAFSWAWEAACEEGWELASEDARELFGSCQVSS